MRPRLTEREKDREICIAGETNFEILTVCALLAKYAFAHDAQTDKKNIRSRYRCGYFSALSSSERASARKRERRKNTIIYE